MELERLQKLATELIQFARGDEILDRVSRPGSGIEVPKDTSSIFSRTIRKAIGTEADPEGLNPHYSRDLLAVNRNSLAGEIREQRNAASANGHRSVFQRDPDPGIKARRAIQRAAMVRQRISPGAQRMIDYLKLRK